jgi:hypothetical protein
VKDDREYAIGIVLKSTGARHGFTVCDTGYTVCDTGYTVCDTGNCK